ncbi:hypothetical protein D3C75_863590 [compost metagenome]
MGRNGQGIIIQHEPAYGEPAFAGDLRPAQQRADPENHFVDVDGLDHIIIGAGQIAGLLIHKAVLGGDGQDRHIVSRLPEPLDQFESVQIGHHNIRYNQIHMLLIQNIQRLLSVSRHHRVIPVFGQNRTHQLAQLLVVLHNQNPDHLLTRLSLSSRPPCMRKQAPVHYTA